MVLPNCFGLRGVYSLSNGEKNAIYRNNNKTDDLYLFIRKVDKLISALYIFLI